MRNIRLFYFGLVITFLAQLPLLARAADVPASPGGAEVPAGGANNANPGGASVTLNNPLGNKTLIDFFNDLLDAVLVLVVPVIIFFIILAGFKYVTARGNASKIEEAHKALLYGILGGVIVIGAKALLVVIKGTVTAFGT